MAFNFQPVADVNNTFTQICIKSEPDGSGEKIESEGSGTKIESEGSGTKIESEGSGTKSNRYCLLIPNNNNFMK